MAFSLSKREFSCLDVLEMPLLQQLGWTGNQRRCSNAIPRSCSAFRRLPDAPHYVSRILFLLDLLKTGVRTRRRAARGIHPRRCPAIGEMVVCVRRIMAEEVRRLVASAAPTTGFCHFAGCNSEATFPLSISDSPVSTKVGIGELGSCSQFLVSELSL